MIARATPPVATVAATTAAPIKAPATAPATIAANPNPWAISSPRRAAACASIARNYLTDVTECSVGRIDAQAIGGCGLNECIASFQAGS